MFAIVIFSLLQMPAALDEDPAYQKAKAQYDDMDYEEAQQSFAMLSKNAELKPQDLATLTTWQGLCQAGGGQLDDAKKSFQQAVRLDIEVKLPIEASPKIAQILEQERKQAKARLTAAEPKQEAQAVLVIQAPPPAKEKGPAPMQLAAYASLGGGLLSLAGGGLLHGFALQEFSRTDDHDLFQQDAQDAVDTSNGLLTSAIAGYSLGAALLAAGGGMLALSMNKDTDSQ